MASVNLLLKMTDDLARETVRRTASREAPFLGKACLVEVTTGEGTTAGEAFGTDPNYGSVVATPTWLF